ncbi:MAG: hypothetical protein V7695_06645 [Sulfitobacter sp.]
MVNGLAALRPRGSDTNDNQDFTMTVEQIREDMKRVYFEIKFPTVAFMKSVTALGTGSDQYVDLDDEAKQKILFCLCSCMALAELEREGMIKITVSSIDASHHVVEKRVEEHCRKVSVSPRRANVKRNGYVVPAGETLLKQYRTYLFDSFDPVDLDTKHSNAGRPVKELAQGVIDLMTKAMEDFLDGQEKHLIRCYEMLQGMMLVANRERSLSVPGHTDVVVTERKFRGLAKSMDPTAVMIGRKGWNEVLKAMRSGFGELKARMIAKVIGIDECEMPL